MKASDSSAIRALRSCIVSTISSRVSPRWPISRDPSARGRMPMTSPPASSAASASTPMSPTLAPPYAMPMPRSARFRAVAAAASAYAGSAPGLDPAYRQTRRSAGTH
jgi:hypothetical protein